MIEAVIPYSKHNWYICGYQNALSHLLLEPVLNPKFASINNLYEQFSCSTQFCCLGEFIHISQLMIALKFYGSSNFSRGEFIYQELGVR